MEENNKIILQPIPDSERNGAMKITPEVREKAVESVEKYIESVKIINITDIARQLNVSWTTANEIVTEITEKWRKQNKKKIEKWRNTTFCLFEELITDTLKTLDDDKMDIIKKSEKIHSIKNLFDELKEIGDFGKEGIEGVEDASKMLSVHFNNLNLSPSMEKELRKVREEKEGIQ